MSNPVKLSRKEGLLLALFACLCMTVLVPEGVAYAAAGYGGVSQRDDRLGDGETDTPSGGSISRGSVSERPEKTVRLGMFLRELEEEGIDGFVLMNGMEDIPIEAPSMRRASVKKMTEFITEITECQVQKTEYYNFLYPNGFEALTQIQLASLDPVYDDINAEVFFGANLPLYMVFTWVSQATGKTIIADNLAAAAVTGELSLGEVPLRIGLEAILKSARAIGVGVDSTPDYVFFYHPGRNPYGKKRSLLINNEGLSAEQTALLERRVTVVLPKAPGTRGPVPFQAGAQRFSKAVQTLSRQLGVPIAIDKALADLPVNPAVFTDLPLSTVLDLIIRQWIYPDIGYEVQKNRIVIRRLIAPGAGERADADMKKVVVGGEETPAEEPDRDTEDAPISPDAAKSASPTVSAEQEIPASPPAKAPVESADEDSPVPTAKSEPGSDVQAAEVEALAKQLAEERAAAEAAAQQAAQMKTEVEEALKRLA
ncbi:MAG: hypothetical protein U9Q79_09065, partial [Candidatus Hydrogenedentes bacterium]|nr:hypothetical protein [Candidatus Hydrogenedentota bacterium]